MADITFTSERTKETYSIILPLSDKNPVVKNLSAGKIITVFLWVFSILSQRKQDGDVL